MYKKLGLCKGRHDLPVDGYVFEEITDPTDLLSIREQVKKSLQGVTKLDLYVTGLTVALTEVINFCTMRVIALNLFHYDREGDRYYSQPMATNYWEEELKEGEYL